MIIQKELLEIFDNFELDVLGLNSPGFDMIKQIKIHDEKHFKVYRNTKIENVNYGKMLFYLFPEFQNSKMHPILHQIIGDIKAVAIKNKNFIWSIEDDTFNWAYHKQCFSSCLFAKSDITKFYQTQSSIKTLTLHEDQNFIGRALLWYGIDEDSDKLFMDRIYPAKNEMVCSLFREYARKNNWWFRLSQEVDLTWVTHSTFNNFGPNKILKYKIEKFNFLKDNGFVLPYQDTFRFYDKSSKCLFNEKVSEDLVVLKDTRNFCVPF